MSTTHYINENKVNIMLSRSFTLSIDCSSEETASRHVMQPDNAKLIVVVYFKAFLVNCETLSLISVWPEYKISEQTRIRF